MASITLDAAPRFPAGSIVEVYPEEAFVNGSGPTLPSVASAAVQATGTLTFAGLAGDVRYVAAQNQAGRWVLTQFRVSSPELTLEDLAALVGSRRVFVSVDDHPFDAALDGASNDAQPLRDAAAYVEAEGGGTVWVGGHAAWLDDDVQAWQPGSNTTVRGTRGKSIIDFSGSTIWRFGSDDACILVAGSIGSTVTLTHDARRPPMAIGVVSITQTAGVATLTTTAAHNLPSGLGVRIRGGGGGATAGQKPYYTETANGVAADPVVITVTGASTFTYPVDPAADASLTSPGTAHVAAFGPIVMCPTAGLAEGDMVGLASDATRTDAASEVIEFGQTSEVARVVTSGMLLLRDALQQELTVAASATLAKIVPVENVHFVDVEIRGKGSNLSATDGGDKGIRFDYARSCSISGVKTTQIDLVAVEFRTTLYCSVTGQCDFDCPQDNVSGRVSGHAYVQYGVAFANGTSYLTIDGGCIFRNWRHGVVQSSTSARPGISRNVTIANCHFFGAWLGAISTHQGFEAGTISGNHFVDCQTAINIRYAERTIIDGNDIFGGEFGVNLSKHWDGCHITNNLLERVWTAISTSSQIDAANAVGKLKINGNTIRESESPIDIRPVTAGTLMRFLEITYNTIERCNSTAILVQVGDSTLSADGFYGSISHNTIHDSNLVTAGNAIRVSNARGVRFIGNSIDTASNMTRGIFADGAGTSGCLERASKISTATVQDVDFSVGTGHSAESVQIEPVTIVAGAVTPRYRNRTHTLRIDTEGGAASDDLDTIVGTSLRDGDRLAFQTATSAHDVVVRHLGGGTGNIRLVGASNFTIDDTRDSMETRWLTSTMEGIEVSRASIP